MTAVGRSVSRVSSPAIRVNRGHQFLPRWDAALLSVVRIVVSFLFACHGAKILIGVVGGVDGHGASAPIGSWPIWWAGVIELLGGALVLLGLFTRPAALLCSGAMAFAYLTVHQPQALLPLQNHGELAVLYCGMFLLIATFGPGRFALDTARWRSQSGQMPSD